MNVCMYACLHINNINLYIMGNEKIWVISSNRESNLYK